MLKVLEVTVQKLFVQPRDEIPESLRTISYHHQDSIKRFNEDARSVKAAIAFSVERSVSDGVARISLSIVKNQL